MYKKCSFVKMGTKTHQLGKRKKRISKKELEDRKLRLRMFKEWI
tara:strand:- start:2226 stop:2357 length:132 start_codon:yes stop_codon:yes gene_type:complete